MEQAAEYYNDTSLEWYTESVAVATYKFCVAIFYLYNEYDNGVLRVVGGWIRTLKDSTLGGGFGLARCCCRRC